MIISIDHGNKQIKSLNSTFTSGLYESESKPAFGEDVLCYNGKYPDDRDIQNRFTAYVNSAFEKTRIKYYYRKKTYEDNLIMIDEDDLECVADSKDILEAFESLDLDMVENMSLWKALQRLSGKDITIIKRHILYNNTFKEIGKVLGMNE